MEQTILQTAIKRWNVLSKEQKTPDFFLSFFTLENGAFESVDEMARNMDAIFALIDAQEWTDAEKDKAKRKIQERADNDKSFISDFSRFREFARKRKERQYYYCNCFKYFNAESQAVEPLKIEPDTLSYIGAMTHRGKTTALISIALDAYQQALESMRNSKPFRRVVIVTAEESAFVIFCRLVRGLLFLTYKDNSDIFYRDNLGRYSVRNCKDLQAEIESALIDEQDNAIFDAGGITLKRAIQQCYNNLIQHAEMGIISIIEHIEHHNFNGLIATVKNKVDDNSLVIVDYLQRLKTPAECGLNVRQVVLQKMSNELADIAKKKHLVMIAGAQFNRNGNKTESESDKYRPDFLSETLFRESGDIEIDADLIIGIGRQIVQNSAMEEPVKRFYEILKYRNHAPKPCKYAIVDNAQFSLFSCSVDSDGKIREYEPIEQSKKEKAGKTKSEPKAAELRGDYC